MGFGGVEWRIYIAHSGSCVPVRPMDLVGDITANLGLVVFTTVAFVLVVYLIIWMIHPESD